MKLDEVRRLAAFEFNHSPEDQERIYEYLRSAGFDPANLYQELEMSSPYVDTHRDISYNNTPVSLHSHSYIEILYCHSAEGVEYLVGPDRYKLQAGDILLIEPGISHRPLLPDVLTTPYVRDVIWINPEFLNAIASSFPYSPMADYIYQAQIRTASTRWEFLGKMFRNGVQEAEEQRPGWEALVIGNTLMILTYLDRAFREHSAGLLKAEKPELTDKVTAYIEEHFADHITVSELARRFYVSESSISHLFKQKLGVSIYRYITQRRLICAKNLIAEGISLDQVAVRVGFTDYSAFYRAFKQEYGISPRQYRSKMT